MSVHNYVLCVTCNKALWVGRGGDQGRLYTGPDWIARLEQFLLHDHRTDALNQHDLVSSDEFNPQVMTAEDVNW